MPEAVVSAFELGQCLHVRFVSFRFALKCFAWRQTAARCLYASIMIIGDRSRLLVVGQDMLGFLFDDVHQPSLALYLLRYCTRKTPRDGGLGDDDDNDED